MLSTRRSRRRSALTACGGLALALVVVGCGAAPSPEPPPIVLVTLEGLRPDALGALGGPAGLAPNLDRFAAEADWAGRAIAASSAPGPALASLLTGLTPHQHGSIQGRPRLRAELESVAQALRAAGYRTAAYGDGEMVERSPSLGQGFDLYQRTTSGSQVHAALRTLRPSRDFLWLHTGLPGGETLVLHERFRDRLPRTRLPLPQRLRQGIGGAPDAEDDAVRRALYASNVAQVDLEIGAYLDELRNHGPWQRALIVLVGVTGWSVEQSRTRGGSLERAQLEVPLLVKLPRPGARELTPPRDERVGAHRLFATLVETAGGTPLPATAPSLYREDHAGVLTQRLAGNGVNEFSLLRGDLLLVRRVRFAPAEPEYDAARARVTGRRTPPAEKPARILRRLQAAYERTLPFSGGEVALALERWLPDGGTAAVEDPAAVRELGAALDQAFFAGLDEERPPEREDKPPGQ